MKYHTGTCSWAEKTLIESHEFYPPDIKNAEDRLKYYAARFDTVEVDSTYYAVPRRQNSLLWSSRTPFGFIFHIKAYGALTGHAIAPGTLPKELRAELPAKEKDAEQVTVKDPAILAAIGTAFAEALSPLKNAGKLGLLVFQFPPWFHFSVDNMNNILNRVQLVSGLPVAIEFRHGSWLMQERRDFVLKFLKDHKLTYVTVDEPQYGALETVPLVPAVTTDIAYFRLHGRNTESWLKKGITTAERFAYRYSDNELDEIKSSVIKVADEAKEIFIMFNNHGSPGIQNAATMKGLLRSKSL
ncbi:MAG TPA: DUF72 domain-containing protein [Dissulfurispiraceae bacterium]|nr:DUF72 domain-containing protein [Dissulfurispiraceae bacterium]